VYRLKGRARALSLEHLVSADLRHFLGQLEERGQLLRVKRPVDPRTELSALYHQADRLGKTILFESVTGHDLRVVANLVAGKSTLSLLFQTAPERLVEEFLTRGERKIAPRVVRSGPVKQVIETGAKCDARQLPLVTHYEKDAAPYITAGIVIAKDPETGFRNASFNRMQLKGADKFGIRMMPPQHLGVIHGKAEALQRNLPAAVVIGHHPFEMLAAATTLPYGSDHLEFASALRGEPLELVRCETVDLEVPSHAELVLEGEVLAGQRESEGPFGEFMHYYVPPMENHVFRLKAITRRADAIFQTTHAGASEDITLLGLSREALVYKTLKAAGYRVHAVSLTPNLFMGAIALRKRFEGEPKNAMMAAFGAYPWLKYCVVVDEDVNVFDVADVWWAVATRSRPDTGVMVVPEAQGFPRDKHHLHQAKLGIDASVPLAAKAEFERKQVPGAGTVRLEDYLKP
jgi:UbiD family decarboxylase